MFHYTVKLIYIKKCYFNILESIMLLLNVTFTVLKADLVTAHTEFLKSFISSTYRIEKYFYRRNFFSLNKAAVQREC